ncbi:FadR/GntR family transcriptional regulator [Kineococcus sp. SYSU DK004]|uniref:FadR/GntR family transcriptional regulator n=1 Tax=Kineococcus sp. SYSU DK004 TaxID=3383125 RepID=UPI003D7E4144
MPSFRQDDPALAQLTLTAVPRGSAAAEVARQLTERVASGQFPPGSRLPPERQLAESLGVGRSAVREALAALEILGLVTVRPGSGTYIRDSMSELLPTTLSWGLMLAGEHTAQLSEVRSALEVQAASLATVRATDADVALLREHVETMEASLDDLDAFVAADAMFHAQIGRAAGNDALDDLLRSTRSLLRVWVERHLQERRQAEIAAREHREVFEAIASGDPGAAERTMRAHMRTAGARIEDALHPRGADRG